MIMHFSSLWKMPATVCLDWDQSGGGTDSKTHLSTDPW